MESGALGAGGDGATDERTGEVETKLKRAIGPKLLTLFIIGDILGAGIYALVGEVGAGVQVPGRGALYQQGFRRSLLHFRGGLRGDVVGHRFGQHLGSGVRR
jgi:hypothetical protein